MSNSKKNPEVVLVDYEENMSLKEAATFLETIAKKLREEGTFTLTQGNDSYDVTPAEIVELEVKLEKEKNKNKFELELEWHDGNKGSSLTID